MTREEDFYRLARQWGRRQAQRLGLSFQEVEDCEQEFLVKWLLKPVDPPMWTWPTEQREAFLRTAARNHALNYLRSLRSATAHLASSVQETQEGRFTALWGAEQPPEAELMREMFWQKIAFGMRALTPEQSLLVRRHAEEESISNLAVALSCSANTLRHRLARAHRRLAWTLMCQGSTEAALRDCLVEQTALYARYARVRLGGERLEKSC